MRTKEEIDYQIEGLLHTKTVTPPLSIFGEPNHVAIDAQVEILLLKISIDELALRHSEDDKVDLILDYAERAQRWLDGEYNKALF